MTERPVESRLPCSTPSRVTIDCDKLAANVRMIKRMIGADVGLMAVVKANAYGHGAATVAGVAMRNGANMLAVANLGEALELRQAGTQAPILVLGYVPAAQIPDAIALDLCLTVFDSEQARQYHAAAKGADGSLSAHIKVDSGMGRLGVLPQNALELIDGLCQQPGLKIDGIYTHFSFADADPSYTSEQLSCFNRLLERLSAAGHRFKTIHAANSAALLACRDCHFNLVRPGLLLYGLNPLARGPAISGLQPVMSWSTVIAQVKTLPPDSPVGYGNTYRTRGWERIAILPVGYADGLRRSPRTWREVLVQGERAQLVGRVSMEKAAINVSHIPGARAGDEVVLLGRQGGDEISADEIAGWIGSINYEVVTSIAPRAPRHFVRS